MTTTLMSVEFLETLLQNFKNAVLDKHEHSKVLDFLTSSNYAIFDYAYFDEEILLAHKLLIYACSDYNDLRECMEHTNGDNISDYDITEEECIDFFEDIKSIASGCGISIERYNIRDIEKISNSVFQFDTADFTYSNYFVVNFENCVAYLNYKIQSSSYDTPFVTSCKMVTPITKTIVYFE